MLFPYKSTAVKSQGKSHRHAQKFLSPRTLQQQKKAGDKARETGKGKRSRKKKLKPKNRSRKATVEWGCAIPKEGVRESPGEVVLEGMGKGVRM